MGRGKRGCGWSRRGDNKRKRAPSPPSEDFGDSEYSEEVSSELDRSPALASPPASSQDSDDSMGLSTVARAYWRSIERAGLSGSDESGISSDEANSSDSSEKWSGGDGDDEGDDSGDASGEGDGGDDGGKGDSEGDGGSGSGDDADGGDGCTKGDGGDGGNKGDGGNDGSGNDKVSGIAPLV
jgi:hypothetical protein